MNKYLPFMGMGFELVAVVMAGVYISDYLEKKFNSKGIITMFVFLGLIIVWFIHLYFMIKKANSNDE